MQVDEGLLEVLEGRLVVVDALELDAGVEQREGVVRLLLDSPSTMPMLRAFLLRESVA